MRLLLQLGILEQNYRVRHTYYRVRMMYRILVKWYPSKERLGHLVLRRPLRERERGLTLLSHAAYDYECKETSLYELVPPNLHMSSVGQVAFFAGSCQKVAVQLLERCARAPRIVIQSKK